MPRSALKLWAKNILDLIPKCFRALTVDLTWLCWAVPWDTTKRCGCGKKRDLRASPATAMRRTSTSEGQPISLRPKAAV